MLQKRFPVCEMLSFFLSSLHEMAGGARLKNAPLLLVRMRSTRQTKRWAGSRTRCPRPQEVGQPAELTAGKLHFEMVAQYGVFHFLDHPGAQEERRDPAGAAPRLAHESLLGWVPPCTP